MVMVMVVMMLMMLMMLLLLLVVVVVIMNMMMIMIISMAWILPDRRHIYSIPAMQGTFLCLNGTSPFPLSEQREADTAGLPSPGVLQKSDGQVLSFLHGAQAGQSPLATCASVRLGCVQERVVITALGAAEDSEWSWSITVDSRHASAKCRHSQTAKENYVQWGSAGPKPRIAAMNPARESCAKDPRFSWVKSSF